jgi:decaprenyl-phosphate phosphoribosyltransferase
MDATRPSAGALLRVARPRQWPKNLLVFAAPAAAGDIGHHAVLARAAAAAAIFLLASVGTYLVNDAHDVAADRLHPRKSLRPVAAGEIPLRFAAVAGLVLVAGSVPLAALLAGRSLATVMAAYACVNLAYTVRLKRLPVVELGCISSGFVLRAVAGGAATGVPLSVWFVIVACFGSLLVAAGKRTAEIHELGEDRAAHRAALAAYPLSFLRSVRVMASTVLVTAYCLWALDRSARPAILGTRSMVWYELSIIPVVLVVLYLELLFEAGRGGAPEELVLADRTLQVLGLAWVGLLAVGIYAL